MKTKRGNMKVISLIVVIVAITFAVIGYLFAKKAQAPIEQPALAQPIVSAEQKVAQSPIIDQTAGWQTYTDKKYGFQLKYPSNLVADVNSGEGFYNVNFHETNKDGALLFQIVVGDSSIRPSLEETKKEVVKTPGQTVIADYVTMPGLSGISVLRVQYRDNTGHPQAPDNDVYTFIKDKNIFSLSFTIPDLANEENALVSSFKVIQ